MKTLWMDLNVHLHIICTLNQNVVLFLILFKVRCFAHIFKTYILFKGPMFMEGIKIILKVLEILIYTYMIQCPT